MACEQSLSAVKSMDDLINSLQVMARRMRERALQMALSAGANGSHLGGGLSMIEIMATLYGGILRLDPENPMWDDRDRFILSKGHGVLAYYPALAEAGFFPGVILYLTYWHPSKERAHTIALFYTGSVIAGIVGSPLSGAILGLHGKFGLDGWQWLFLLEGIPAVLMAVVIFIFLPNGPQKVKWLSQGEKKWIQSRLDDEIAQEKGKTKHSLSEALSSGRVWLLCLIYFLMNVGGYGYEMWMPSIIQGFSVNNYATVGLINAIPYVVAMVVMLIVGYSSDRTGERRWHIAIAAFVAAIGFAFSAYLKNPYLAMVTLTLALVGIKSTIGPFWVLGTMFLSGTAAAGGIALINSVGNLGGFVGPTLVGIVKDKTGSIGASMWFLGGALLLMGLFTLVVRANPHKKSKLIK